MTTLCYDMDTPISVMITPAADMSTPGSYMATLGSEMAITLRLEYDHTGL